MNQSRRGGGIAGRELATQTPLTAVDGASLNLNGRAASDVANARRPAIPDGAAHDCRALFEDVFRRWVGDDRDARGGSDG